MDPVAYPFSNSKEAGNQQSERTGLGQAKILFEEFTTCRTTQSGSAVLAVPAKLNHHINDHSDIEKEYDESR
jgi:hypothetical protein